MNCFLRCCISTAFILGGGCTSAKTTWFVDSLNFGDANGYYFSLRTDKTVTEPYVLSGHRGERTVSSEIMVYLVKDLGNPKLQPVLTVDCEIDRVCDDDSEQLRNFIRSRAAPDASNLNSSEARKLHAIKFECNDPLFIDCSKPVMPSTYLSGQYVRVLREVSGTSVIVFDGNGKIIRKEAIRFVP